MDINVLTILIGLIKGVDNVAQVRDDLADRFLYIAVLLLTAGPLPMYITGLLHGREQLWIRMGSRVISITTLALVLASHGVEHLRVRHSR